MSALSSFHSEDYLENFYNLCAEDDPEKIDKEVMEEYGLGEFILKLYTISLCYSQYT